jgi:hypothetical protein
LAALMALTGRSPGELIKSGTFESIVNEVFAVSFSPTGVGAKSQLICLVEGEMVIKAISRLRSHRDTQSLRYQSPSAIDLHCQLYVAKAISQYLPFDNLEAMNQAYSAFTQSAAASLPQTKSHPATMVYNLYGSDKQRLLSLTQELGFDGTQPEVFRAFLDSIELKLRSEKSELHRDRSLDDGEEHDRNSQGDPNSTINHLAQTLTWLTSEVKSLRQLLLDVEKERDSLKQDLEKASAFSSQIERLQNENISLKSQLQQQRAKLDSLSNLLGNGSQSAIASPKKEKSLSSRPFQDEGLASSTETSQSLAPNLPSDATEKTSPVAIAPDGTAKAAIALQQTSDALSGRGEAIPSCLHGGKAVARAKRIFEAIQQWNSLHPDDLFAINRGLLETVFGINRKAVGIFTDSHAEILEQYHHSLGISPFSHNRGKDTSLLKAFVSQVLESRSPNFV